MTNSEDTNPSFSDKELEWISTITSDWLNEGIVIPPFEPELSGLLNKLGLSGSSDIEPETFPKTQEWLSRHGVMK